MLKYSKNTENPQSKDFEDHLHDEDHKNLEDENLEHESLEDKPETELEKAFKESADQLQVIADNPMNHIGQVDVNGIYQYISPSIEISLGYEPSELIGKSFFEFIHPDDVEKTRDAVQRCVTTSVPEMIQNRFKHAEGYYVWRETIGNPIFDDQGQINGAVYSSRDINGQKVMEEELQISQEHFKSIFHQSPIATAIITMDQRFKRVNRQFCHLTGYSREDLNSITILDIVHPDDIEKNREKVQGLVNGDIDQHRTEKRYVRKDGDIVWVSINLSLIRDKNGRPIHFISMIEDVTERKKAQEEIEASLEEQKILMGEIHQRVFNNLQLISNLLEVQYLDSENGSTITAGKTHHNRVKAVALIHEKLYKSEDFVIIDFADHIHCLKEHLIDSYSTNADSLEFEILTENPVLDVDAAVPCSLILNELITNSITHAFPEGMSGKITVEFRFENGKISLSVTDNGVGFDPREIMENEKSGLKLVDTLVKQLNGKIEFNKTSGTEFRIEFMDSDYLSDIPEV